MRLLTNLKEEHLQEEIDRLCAMEVLYYVPEIGFFYSASHKRTAELDTVMEKSIGDFMSIAVTIQENASVYDAIVLMFLEDTGSLFVVKEGSLAGVISRKDLLKAVITNPNIKEADVGEYMSCMPNLVYLYPQDTLLVGVEKMIYNSVDGIPVVERYEKDGREILHVVGRFSKSNITRILLEILSD